MPTTGQSAQAPVHGREGERNIKVPTATSAARYVEPSKTNAVAQAKHETGFADESGAQWISVRNQNYVPHDMRNGVAIQKGDRDGLKIGREGPYSILRQGPMRTAVDMQNRKKVQSRGKRS